MDTLRCSSTTYGYALQNPLYWVDFNGLWSIGIEGYAGVGGGATVSYANGVLEIYGRFGVGFGFGFSYDPFGEPLPISDECGSTYILNTSANFSAGVGIGVIGADTSITIGSGNAITTPMVVATLRGL